MDSWCDWETVQHPEGPQYCWTQWEWEFERVPAVSDQRENKKVELWSFTVARKSANAHGCKLNLSNVSPLA